MLRLDDPTAERAIPGPRRAAEAGPGQIVRCCSADRPAPESSVVDIKNKSHAVTAEIEVADSGARGVIVAQGGLIGG